MARQERYVVGLDIGTAKVCTVVGALLDDGGVDVIGIGITDSHSVRRGVGVQLGAAVDSIEKFKGHPAFRSSQDYGVDGPGGCDGWAILGNGPSVTQWCMSHGAGGGTENVTAWVDDAEELWVRAGKQIS